MPTSELQRTHAFRTAFARRQATEVREVPGGFLVLNETFPLSYEHNQLHLDGPVDPAALPGLADQLLADHDHRQLTVYGGELGAACAPVLVAAGYQHMTEVVMVHRGPVAAPALPATPVEIRELARPYEARLRDWIPNISPAGVEQLIGRRTARLSGAAEVFFLGARASDGELAAWADLYLDRAAGIAQIEDLVTALEHTGQGHGDTVLAGALLRAADCPLRFLVADGEDWPMHWYARRGFVPVGECHAFTRSR